MPRLPSLARWLGLALSILLAALWLASYPYQLNLQLGNRSTIYGLNSGAGAILLERLEVSRAATSPWRFEASADRHSAQTAAWLPRIYSGPLAPGASRMSYLDILIPYWLPLLTLSAATAYLFHRARRAAQLSRANSCPHCTYPLTGLAPNSPCPECGRPESSPT